MPKPVQSEINSEDLRNKLKLKLLEAQKELFEKYPHFKKLLDEKNVDLLKLRQHASKVLTTSALTGTLLFSPPNLTSGVPVPSEIVKDISNLDESGVRSGASLQESLIKSLSNILPEKVGPLSRTQEKYLEQVFKNIIGVNARATLEGEHLNTTYGLIGLEQHLIRYPGDSVAYMAPGRGAWGYFAPSKSQLTPEDIEREKWYAVVQTLYLPDWESRLSYLRDWYKYRKVLIVNTVNGNAVVADIADSGPAMWTGKNFGGSPEVMQHLGGSRYTKGPVVLFFVDDPENKVPLGPVDYNNIKSLGVKMVEA